MNEKIFKDGMADLGIGISDAQVESFNKYSALLKEWNEKMNLTAVVDDEGIFWTVFCLFPALILRMLSL